jgi:dihydroxy-acid dehydratase
VGHITPEAVEGGNIGIIQDNDVIEISAITNTINLLVSDEDIAKRRANWIKPEPPVKSGVLYKYYKLVKNATEGCVTDGD